MAVGTRSDIYSLGVLLYQLLSGETPFGSDDLRSAAFDEQLRIIREDDAPRISVRLSTSKNIARVADLRQTDPSRLKTLVSRDLEWIVMKALGSGATNRPVNWETTSGGS